MASFLEQLEAIPAAPQQPSGGGFLSKLDAIVVEPQREFDPEQQKLISIGQQYVDQQESQGKPVSPNLAPDKLLSIGEGLQNLQTAQKGAQQAQENPTWQDVYAGQAAAGAVDFEQGLRILGAALDDDLLSDENLGTIAQQEEVKANFPQTEGMKKIAQSTGFLDTASALLGDIPGTLGPTLTRSLVQGAVPMAAGAAIGGATANVPGALIGTGAGAGVADAVQSFGDYLRQKNINLADPTAIRTALQDPEIKKEALKYAGIRGLIIGATSALGGSVAGKVASVPAKTLIGRGAAITGDVALQSGIEGGGEAAAQLATTGKINPSDVAAEAIVGLPFNAAETTIGGVYQARQQALTSKDIETPNKIKPIDLRPDGDPQVAATEAEILAKSEAMVKSPDIGIPTTENLGTINQPEEQNAVQIETAAEKMLRDEVQRPSQGMELQGVEQQNQPEVASETSEKVTPQNLGPGAASALEFALMPKRTTSTKNAVTNEERAVRGDLEVLREAIQSNEDTFQVALDRLDVNPNVGQEVVNGLLSGSKKEVSEVDEAILLHEKIRLMNERTMEEDRIFDPYTSEEEKDAARARWKDAETKINLVDQATRKSGTIWGRLGQFRQRLMRDDYTFEAMERKARVSKDRPLTAEESEEIRKLSEKINELETQLEEATTRSVEKEAETESKKEFTKLKQEAAKQNASNKKERLNLDTASQRAKLIEGLQNRKAAGDKVNDLRAFIQKLALNLVRSGTNEREALLDQVHAIVSEIFPDLTRTQTRDLISGYGDFKPLDQEPAKVTLRGLKGEMQQIGKIEDMMAKTAPRKTGIERRTPTDEERRLIKEVNELKKKGGFEVTDPATQLKTALAAIKTRLQNEIRDLETALATKEPLVKKDSSIQYDAEADALRAIRDQKKAEYAELFPPEPLTEEQLIERTSKSLDRSISQLEADLKSGKLYGEKSRKLTSPEIEAKRARLNALREERQNLRNLDTAVIEANREAALQKSIADVNKIIVPKPAEYTADTEKVAQLKAELAQAREAKRLAKSKDSELQEERKIKALESSIKRAEENQTPAEKQYTADSARVAELKARLQEIRDAQAASPEAQQKKIDAAIKQTERSIAEYDRRLQESDFVPKPTKDSPSSPELEALRAERDAMRELVRQLREAEKPKKTADEIRLQSYKTRTANRIAELQEKQLTGDFEKKEIKPLVLDKEAQDLQYRLNEAKREFNRARFNDLLARRPKIQKIWHSVRDTLNTARAIMTSLDFSAVLRQGGFITLGNPMKAFKRLPDMFKAFASPKEQFRIDKAVRDRPLYDLGQKAGLYIADPLDPDINKMEEAYMSRWAEKIPLVAGSQRAYTTFLNALRADAFDSLVKTLGKNGAVTPEEAKALANYVNVATGRGNLAGANKAGASLNALFFAPRLVMSRFELLTGAPLAKGSFRTRKAIAAEYAKFLIGIGVVYALAQAGGGEIEWDPRSSDFGKIRVGNTRIDPLAGLSQVAVLMSRIASGEKKTISGKVQPIRAGEGVKIPYGGQDTTDVVKNFVRSKLSPVAGGLLNVAAGENVIGEPATPQGEALRMVVPLAYSDILEAMEEQGVPKGTALGLMSIFGWGISTYEQPKK